MKVLPVKLTKVGRVDYPVSLAVIDTGSKSKSSVAGKVYVFDTPTIAT